MGEREGAKAGAGEGRRMDKRIRGMNGRHVHGWASAG